MKTFLLICCFLMLLSCGHQNTTNKTDAPEITTATVEEVSSETTDIVPDSLSNNTEDDVVESLNEIRFDGWGKSEWLDNDYIRAVRKYINEYLNGNICNPDLDEYKDVLKGKFVVYEILPYLAGGAFIYIIFYDNPKYIFASGVRSSVDEETREVYDYYCGGLRLQTSECDITQEEIKKAIDNDPELKLW
ncbi:MAG: hypothetical protein IKK02_03985 [Tidjanibacter sp.]|nr:hypothetical protein [Tidjanibacter sp.]